MEECILGKIREGERALAEAGLLLSVAPHVGPRLPALRPEWALGTAFAAHLLSKSPPRLRNGSAAFPDSAELWRERVEIAPLVQTEEAADQTLQDALSLFPHDPPCAFGRRGATLNAGSGICAPDAGFIDPGGAQTASGSRGDDRSMADLNAIRSILLGLTRPTLQEEEPENLVNLFEEWATWIHDAEVDVVADTLYATRQTRFYRLLLQYLGTVQTPHACAHLDRLARDRAFPMAPEAIRQLEKIKKRAAFNC